MMMAIQRSPVSGILIMYTFVICWFVGGLTTFHLYLISSNQVSYIFYLLLRLVFSLDLAIIQFPDTSLSFPMQTTYENFRYQYDRKMNPYNVGIARNCMEVFCSKMPRSRNNFRALIKGDSPVGSYTGPTGDVEMGRRRGLDADDFDDTRHRVGNLGRLERCRTQPRHDHWEERRGNWR